MFYAYITASARNGTLYTGQFPGFSKKYKCKYLVWYEEHDSRDAAFQRERRIKEWKRVWKLGLIEKHNPDWLDIMACPVWPLPKGALFADLRQAALMHKLDPALRRGERV